MKNIKVLGTGCATCKRLLADVNQMVVKNGWQAEVEYVTDLPSILSYGIMETPALVVDEKVVMTGYPGALKVEQALSQVDAS